MIYRRLQSIVKVSGAVPDPISLVNKHMVHLHREIHIKCRVPGVPINISVNPEWFCAHVTVFNDIQTRFLYSSEIKMRIIIIASILLCKNVFPPHHKYKTI